MNISMVISFCLGFTFASLISIVVFYKSKEELDEIKRKISNANFGKNNGMSKSFKGLNIVTGEIIHFDTLTEACRYFNHKQKSVFLMYCEKLAKYRWRKEWTFAYEENNFNTNLEIEYDKSCHKGTKVKLIDLDTNEEKIFNSLNKLNAFLGIKKGTLKFENNECIYDAAYKIIKI